MCCEKTEKDTDFIRIISNHEKNMEMRKKIKAKLKLTCKQYLTNILYRNKKCHSVFERYVLRKNGVDESRVNENKCYGADPSERKFSTK